MVTCHVTPKAFNTNNAVLHEKKSNTLPVIQENSFQTSVHSPLGMWKEKRANPQYRSSLIDNSRGFSEENLKHGTLDARGEKYSLEKASLGVVTKAEVPKNNVVDLDRIARGLDTRTTLMLRNIPNKVDQHMLKNYIDVTNENTYDFLCEYYKT